jgi:hypothetical protein
VTQRDQALDRAGLVRALAEQARARVVFGQHRLEVAVEDEGAIGRAQELARQRRAAGEPVVKGGQRRAKVEGDDGRAPRRTRMVARIREASRGLEQHLEFEQRFVAAFQLELGQPRLALRALLTLQRSRFAQQRLIRILTHRDRKQASARRDRVQISSD